MNILSPGTRIGQYEIASRPMMGGMGVVYFALDHSNDGRPVALKTFRPELLPDRAARDRFLREGTAWIELGSHPHIVRCYKVEYIDPTAFLVLELIAKEQNMPDASLRSWLIPGRPLPLGQALLFALQIARGMQYATEKIPGFVHRDLKPENILVGADKLPGTNINRLRVTDFGLVKTIADGGTSAIVVDSEELKPNQVQFTRGVGTPLYMAAEQWKGEPVGVFTDVYAFGCILYEMLSGQYAPEGKTLTDLQVSHCEGKVRPLPASLSKELVTIATKCLALNPFYRYRNWDEILHDLERVIIVQTGKIAPLKIESAEMNRRDQIQVGWSHSTIGLAYQGMGRVKMAMDYFRKALAIARNTGDQLGEGDALGNLGNAYADLGDVRRAISYYESQIAIMRAMGSRRGESKALGSLGIAYKNLGDVQQAIGYYDQELVIVREIGDRLLEGATLLNLGNAYRNLGNLRRAISFYEQSLIILREIGDRRGEGFTLSALGTAYLILGDTQGIRYCEQSLIIARAIGDRGGEAVALGNLGNAYRNLGDVQRAIDYYEQALVIRREIGDIGGIATDSFNMALLYSEEEQYARALLLAQEAERIWTHIGNPNAERARQLVAELQVDTVSKSTSSDSIQAAFEAFRRAISPQDMQVAANQYPFMVNKQFNEAVEEIINEQVSPEQKSSFELRLTWLRQIAAQK